MGEMELQVQSTYRREQEESLCEEIRQGLWGFRSERERHLLASYLEDLILAEIKIQQLVSLLQQKGIHREAIDEALIAEHSLQISQAPKRKKEAKKTERRNQSLNT